jgi:hypothetical protein
VILACCCHSVVMQLDFVMLIMRLILTTLWLGYDNNQMLIELPLHV